MMLYMITRMPADASGLTIEYTANRNGSVQFDSICHPSHAATLNDLIVSEFNIASPDSQL
jgi:hypothetical protein